MNESILKALMRLFAIVANVNKESVSTSSREIVESYLQVQLSKKLVEQYLQLFDEYLSVHHKKGKDGSVKSRKRTSLNSVKVLMICHEINEELQQKEKIIVLIRLLEFVGFSPQITEKELEFVQTVADTFNISTDEYNQVKEFIIGDIAQIENKESLLFVDNKTDRDYENSKIKHITQTHLNGCVYILNIKSTNTFLMRYIGEDELYMNSQNLLPKRMYILDNGAVIKSSRISPVYYSDISGQFIREGQQARIELQVDEIEFYFKNSENGIQPMSFEEESGHLVGIMGGSGVGKSTLLNVLNGNLRLNSGSIKINGYDLHQDKEMLEGVIGFVPQDDLLIEELTVFQNLYYNAKLCFKDFSEMGILRKVVSVLIDLDLYDIRHLTVGNPMNKFISGGQRKRLNIALELIREPSILIVDEPTSGLSSQDSEMVMTLLKGQTLKGKLVLVNIHQPSSDIYKLFDKLLVLDKGGHLVYMGNPIDAVVYFKTVSNHVNAAESECPTCGNVNPEQVLQILEAKVVNEYGKFTRNRKISPKEWYQLYKKNIESKFTADKKETQKTALPKNFFKVPGRFKQFLIFSIRNILAKLTNKQYLLITFLEAPLLAIILGYFTKYISGTADDPMAYLFSQNQNIPAYLFMVVIVALFFGMTVSAEEIIKDQRILKRESFLNLSRLSYLNSKIMVLFLISAIQSISFLVVGNFVLGIKDLYLEYWLIMFTTMAFANMFGLNISSALNSVVTIYIIIPFVLVPQILLSGVIVEFDKLHKSVSSPLHVPVVGDLMTSRWAYEALAVVQYKNNEYQKHFFKVDKLISDASYIQMYAIPELREKVNVLLKHGESTENIEILKQNFKLVLRELKKIDQAWDNQQFEQYNQFHIETFNSEVAINALAFLDEADAYFTNRVNWLNGKRDEIYAKLVTIMGSEEAVTQLKQDYHNERLAEIVRNKQEISKLKIENGMFIQLKDPIFKSPEKNNGRAHFYASHKQIGGFEIDTLVFNVGFIWLTTLIMYLFLVFDVFRKTIAFSQKYQISKYSKKVSLKDSDDKK